MSKITVILADDHTLVRKGIKAMLESDEEITVVAEADNGLQALEQSREFQPDLVVMDVRMPVMNGLDACSKLKEYAPRSKVLILSMHDSE
ncbi:MAG TPA: response regulator transcription factor, partial [Anseongella sp.]|nr:response regulator transcription factor [Anseongella sp.]